MSEINLILFDILIILIIFIISFIYSVLSTDTLITLISFLIFLILLIPFYKLLAKLRLIIFVNNLENFAFFNILFFYSNLINLFIGICLFLELIYLFFFY